MVVIREDCLSVNETGLDKEEACSFLSCERGEMSLPEENSVVVSSFSAEKREGLSTVDESSVWRKCLFFVSKMEVVSVTEEGSAVVYDKEEESRLEKNSAALKGYFLVGEREVLSGSEEGIPVVVRSCFVGKK